MTDEPVPKSELLSEADMAEMVRRLAERRFHVMIALATGEDGEVMAPGHVLQTGFISLLSDIQGAIWAVEAELEALSRRRREGPHV